MWWGFPDKEKNTMRQRFHPVIFSAFLVVLTFAHGLRAEPPRYVATWLPPLETPDGTSFHPQVDSFSSAAINNARQVGVTARSGGDHQQRAVRYTLGGDPEDLQPATAEQSRALAINERGQVYGLAFGPEGERDVFIETPGKGFDFLENGKGDRIRRHFRMTDMNDVGDLVGHVAGTAVIYTAEEGWRNLAKLDSRIRSPRQINNRGDFLFMVAQPGGVQLSFLWADGELFELGDTEVRVSVPADLNEAARVAGIYRDEANRQRAYVFAPKAGFVEVPARNFRMTAALEINEAGVIGGIFTPGHGGKNGIFVYDSAAGPASGLRVLAKASDFRRIVPANVSFKSFSVRDMNEQLQFIGTVTGKHQNGRLLTFAFMASPETGVVSLEGFFDEGVRRHVDATPVDINDHGDILLDVGQNPGRLVVLSPDTLTPPRVR